MFIWLISLVLFLVWLVLFARRGFTNGGFVHVFLLCAIAVAVVQFVADRRAARG